jgi:hypothetical protein
MIASPVRGIAPVGLINWGLGLCVDSANAQDLLLVRDRVADPSHEQLCDSTSALLPSAYVSSFGGFVVPEGIQRVPTKSEFKAPILPREDRRHESC